MSIFLAALPILLIVTLMTGLRWSASRAGSAGYLVALFISIIFFGTDLKIIGYAHLKSFFLSVDVLLIVWAAFLLYKVADEAGAITIIGKSLQSIARDKTLQGLLIGWVFASILQGVGGFGVPVAVTAPILIGLGFSPLAAIIIPSLGHGWAVTFGSLGSSFNAMMAATALPDELLAPFTAIFLGIAGIISGWLISIESGGKAGLKKNFFLVLVAGAAMGAAQYLAATNHLWNIAALAGGVAGATVLILVILIRTTASKGGFNWKELLLSSSNYLVLIILILTIQFFPGLKQFLGQIKINLPIPQLETSLGHISPAGSTRSIPVFIHAGSILLYASVIGFLIFDRKGFYKSGTAKRILSETWSRMMGGSIGILTMVAMASIMETSGMTQALARGLSQTLASLFPAISPWIGALGAFISGSNTNSNVLFSLLQLNTAELLNYPVAIILAAQTSGAALASVLAPTKIVVGASTTGLTGKEGIIMAKLAIRVLILVFVISLLSTLFVWLLR